MCVCVCVCVCVCLYSNTEHYSFNHVSAQNVKTFNFSLQGWLYALKVLDHVSTQDANRSTTTRSRFRGNCK